MQTTKQKYAQCGDYLLVKPLGSGYNSKVKLGYNPTNNQYAAVKMIKHSHPSLNLKTLKKEIEILQQLSHPNIVNLLNFSESIDYVKKNGNKYKVVCIVMELVANGELFEYVADSGRFSEDVARTYFRTIIETLEYCHGQGYAHRDMKPENLLFDSEFNLKIADFGFATLLAGKDGSGTLNTVLGTESYMAPEIHQRQPYSGPAVDLFATAIILFILISGTPPFAKADPKNDPHYKLLCNNRHSTFWSAHERNKPKEQGKNFYSDDFKDLMNAMLGLDPTGRPTISQIKEHKWYNGNVLTKEELQTDFAERKKKVDAELQRQREAKEAQRRIQQQQANFGSNAYGGVKPFRSAETDMLEALNKSLEGKIELKSSRDITEYQTATSNPRTEIFTVRNSDLVFKFLCSIVLNVDNKMDGSFSNEAFKIKVAAKRDTGSSSFNVVLTKVDDTTTCIEFHKKTGDLLTFYSVLEEMKTKFTALEKEIQTTDEKEASEVKAE